MSAGSAGTTTVKASPNVIPMIDIMLVLLIIFMIVTPLISAGFKATMPKGIHLDARPEGRRRDHPRHRRERQLLPERTADPEGDAGGPAQVDLLRPNHGQDSLFQGGQSAAVRENPGGGGDRPKAGARVMAAITEPKAAGLFAAPEKKGKS
jgi:hypothetical protein